jgi:hypothetical protein
MNTVAQGLSGPEIEVVAKATRRRFTIEYKPEIVREADGCKGPGGGHSPAPRGTILLPSGDMTRGASAAIW